MRVRAYAHARTHTHTHTHPQAARQERKKIAERVQAIVREAGDEERASQQAQLDALAAGTRAAKHDLASLRKLAKAMAAGKPPRKGRKAGDKEGVVSLPPLTKTGLASGRSTPVSTPGRTPAGGSVAAGGGAQSMAGGSVAAARQRARQHLQESGDNGVASTASGSLPSSLALRQGDGRSVSR